MQPEGATDSARTHNAAEVAAVFRAVFANLRSALHFPRKLFRLKFENCVQLSFEQLERMPTLAINV